MTTTICLPYLQTTAAAATTTTTTRPASRHGEWTYEGQTCRDTAISWSYRYAAATAITTGKIRDGYGTGKFATIATCYCSAAAAAATTTDDRRH